MFSMFIVQDVVTLSLQSKCWGIMYIYATKGVKSNMGELMYFINLDKKEMYHKVQKYREWELNHKYLVPLVDLLSSRWKGDRIALQGEYTFDDYDNYTDITNQVCYKRGEK